MSLLRSVNQKPIFTKNLVSHGAFIKSPLVVVDVGARGGFESHWDIYQQQIRLIGFEPDSRESNRQNKQSIPVNEFKKSNDRRCYPMALFDSVGKKKFHFVVNFPQASSFYKIDTVFMRRFYDVRRFAREKVTYISTTTLDSFIESEKIDPVDFLKIDAEGSEYNVLGGAKKVLKDSILGLTLEVGFSQIYNNTALFAEIDQFLRSRNFKLFDLGVGRFLRRSSSSDWRPAAFGQVISGHVLYFRDAVEELSQKRTKNFWSDMRILKLASLFEIYNLADCSIELIGVAKNLGFLKNYDLAATKSLLKENTDHGILSNILKLFR